MGTSPRLTHLDHHNLRAVAFQKIPTTKVFYLTSILSHKNANVTIYALLCTVTKGLSVPPHVQHLATSNAQILYAMKILRAHGLCRMAIQAVFSSVILARLLYASPA